MCGWDFSAHFAAPFTPIIWHMRMGVNLSSFTKNIKNWVKFHFFAFGKTYHIAVSEAVKNIINSLHPHHKCLAIANALETSRLPSSFVLPRDKKPFRLLMFGWMPETKGLDTALDACESLNQQETLIELLISAQKKTFEYMTKRYGSNYPEWVRLLPPTSNVASIYQQADMMVSASRSEGFSFCLAEAIYCGLPVIYSDIPGTSWAGEFQCTYCFKVANAMDLCRAIRECISHGIKQENQRFNRVLINQKYSLDTWCNKIVDFIESIPLAK